MYVYVCMCMCLRVCVFVCVCMFACVCVRMCVYARVRVSLYRSMRACMSVCIRYGRVCVLPGVFFLHTFMCVRACIKIEAL